MNDSSGSLGRHAVFANQSHQVPRGTGVRIVEIGGAGIATVHSRLTKASEVAGRIQAVFGLELPQGNYYRSRGSLALVGTGPESWLALKAGGGEAFANELADVLAGCASVADQSSGLTLLRLSGPNVRETLAKVLLIDLHPRAFRVGDAASTAAALIGVTIWRREDASDGPTFDLAVYRSYAASLRRTLIGSAAEFGVTASNDPLLAADV